MKPTIKQRKSLKKIGTGSARRRAPHPAPAATAFTDVTPRAVARAIDGLTGAFVWRQHPDGSDYWNDVCDRLARTLDPSAKSWTDVNLDAYLEPKPEPPPDPTPSPPNWLHRLWAKITGTA